MEELIKIVPSFRSDSIRLISVRNCAIARVQVISRHSGNIWSFSTSQENNCATMACCQFKTQEKVQDSPSNVAYCWYDKPMS